MRDQAPEGSLLVEVQRLKEQLASEGMAREEDLHEVRRDVLSFLAVERELLSLSLQEIPVQELLQRALQEIVSAPGFSFRGMGVIFLAEEDDGVLSLAVNHGVPDGAVRACAKVPFGRCLCGRAAESQEVQYEPGGEDRRAACLESIPDSGSLCVPIVSSGRTLGVLNVFVPEGRPRKTEEEFLQAVSHTLAGVLVRRKEHEELHRAEERFRALFHLAPDAYFLHDLDGRFLDGNRAAEEMIGYKKEELIGKSFLEAGILPPKEIPRAAKMLEQTREGHPPPMPVEIELVKKDGSLLLAEVHWVPVIMAGERIVIGLARDITPKKETEVSARMSSALFRELFEGSPLPIAVLDEKGRILRVNRGFERTFGYGQEESRGRMLDELIVPEEEKEAARQLIEKALKGEVVGARGIRKRKDGSLLDVEITGHPIQMNGGVRVLYAIYQDVTEKRRMEEQLRQAQKMEALGRLAGGVAHDFNNALTTIVGHADLILASLRPEDPLYESAAEIKRASQSAVSITRQLLTFSRKQVVRPQVVDLNIIIGEMEKMLRRIIGEDIELVTSLAPDLGAVRVDPAQMEQVLMNLAVNARDAMPKGGRLTIETANVELGEDYFRSHAMRPRPGPYVRLAVTDTGVGMDRETRSRIFDPFFTTKTPGKGTGLGLSTVYGIVEQSGGFIEVSSEPGRGSTFKIYLPRVEEKARRITRKEKSFHLFGGSETVLLVEDETSVRGLAKRVLEDCGYRVIEARDAKEALEAAVRHQGEIDLLLTDVVLPGMNGGEVAEQLKEGRPDLKVIFMSGYPDDVVLHQIGTREGFHFIEKPFTPEDLARKVRAVLDRG